MSAPRVFFIAGETSGDRHAAAVAKEIKKLEPAARIAALGGPKLEAAGAELFSGLDFTEHAVMGVLPVIKKLPFFLKMRREVLDFLKADPPDVVVPVDYPGFNMRLAQDLKRAQIPVCYYVSPQVWAWRPGRIHKYGRSVDHMMVLFEFEVALYEAIGTPVTHVGHPLFDSLAAERAPSNIRKDMGLEPDQPMVGLLPGSRLKEVRTILPELLGAARIIAAERPDVAFAVPVARASMRGLVDALVAELGAGLPITVFDGRAHEVMSGARVALTASGTATLELAFYKTPMVIVYKIGRGQKLGLPILGIELIGLVNIIYGRELCLEFLDAADRSADVAAEALRLLKPGKRRKDVISGLRRVCDKVGKRGTARNAAEVVLAVARGE